MLKNLNLYWMKIYPISKKNPTELLNRAVLLYFQQPVQFFGGVEWGYVMKFVYYLYERGFNN